jgi:signal transduction histidine kinase
MAEGTVTRELQTVAAKNRQISSLTMHLMALVGAGLLLAFLTEARVYAVGSWPLVRWLFASAWPQVAVLASICALAIGVRRRLSQIGESNRTLVASLEAKTRQLTRWGELSYALITDSNLDRLLDLIVETAIEVTGGDSGSLMLIDEDRPELRMRAAYGLSAEVVAETRVPVGTGIAGWVAASGKPLLLRRSQPPPSFASLLKRHAEISSAISVPLTVERRVVGTLNVNEHSRASEFTEDDVRALTMFANQASLALEKAQLYQDAQRQLDRLLGVLDELARTQAQLVHSEKLASVGVLAGGVAHEINNPLTVVLGRTELLLARTDLPETARTALEVMRGETMRISEIVRSLLAFSRRGQEMDEGPVDVGEVIEWTLALIEQQFRDENIAVIRDYGRELPPVAGRSGELQQVFTNIIINAFHSMPRGGELKITTRSIPGDQVVIRFQDTGCGIPKEDVCRIFDPFFTTKTEGIGTGLGLAVSHSIVQSYGGRIAAESEIGQGTCLIIQLPTRPQTPSDGVRGGTAATVEGAKTHV